eukprot:2274201-Rhodomonas_salina.1
MATSAGPGTDASPAVYRLMGERFTIVPIQRQALVQPCAPTPSAGPTSGGGSGVAKVGAALRSLTWSTGGKSSGGEPKSSAAAPNKAPGPPPPLPDAAQTSAGLAAAAGVEGEKEEEEGEGGEWEASQAEVSLLLD